MSCTGLNEDKIPQCFKVLFYLYNSFLLLKACFTVKENQIQGRYQYNMIIKILGGYSTHKGLCLGQSAKIYLQQVPLNGIKRENLQFSICFYNTSGQICEKNPIMFY